MVLTTMCNAATRETDRVRYRVRHPKMPGAPNQDEGLGGGESGGPCRLVSGRTSGNSSGRAKAVTGMRTGSARMPKTVAQWAKQAMPCMLVFLEQSEDIGHGMLSCDSMSTAVACMVMPASAFIPAAKT